MHNSGTSLVANLLHCAGVPLGNRLLLRKTLPPEKRPRYDYFEDAEVVSLQDQALLEASCRQGRDLGFDGKSLIHPNQIAAANAAFAPDDEELNAAREIIDAFEQAQAEGKGVVVVNGRLVENLHGEEAQRQLALAAAIGNMTAQ